MEPQVSKLEKPLEAAEKEKVVVNEDSYTQRRMLFKNIWETAMTIDEKEDILTKPKVIKTLRLDEVDKMVVGKSRKQRIKNLRHVCKRILEFCDRQDADDKFYEQLTPAGQGGQQVLMVDNMDSKSQKKKSHKGKKKMKKYSSLFDPNKEITIMKASVSDRKKGKRRTSKVSSPIGKKKISPTSVKVEASNSLGNSPNMAVASTALEMKTDLSLVKRKLVKKKRIKKKNMTSDSSNLEQAISKLLNSKTNAFARRTNPNTTSQKPVETQDLTRILSAAIEINRT